MTGRFAISIRFALLHRDCRISVGFVYSPPVFASGKNRLQCMLGKFLCFTSPQGVWCVSNLEYLTEKMVEDVVKRVNNITLHAACCGRGDTLSAHYDHCNTPPNHDPQHVFQSNVHVSPRIQRPHYLENQKVSEFMIQGSLPTSITFANHDKGDTERFDLPARCLTRPDRRGLTSSRRAQ